MDEGREEEGSVDGRGLVPSKRERGTRRSELVESARDVEKRTGTTGTGELTGI